jgi:hypothetical protein
LIESGTAKAPESRGAVSGYPNIKNVFEYKNEKGWVVLQITNDLCFRVVYQIDRTIITRNFNNYFKAQKFYMRKMRSLAKQVWDSTFGGKK